MRRHFCWMNRVFRFWVVWRSTCLWAVCWCCGLASGQAFPSRPLTIVVPWPASGAADFVARALAKELEPLLGQTVIVENAPGAGGSLGVAKALRAPADGHTLILSSPLDVVLAPLSFPSAGFTAQDARAVILLGHTDLMLVTRPELGAQSLADLVAMLKTRAEKPLSYCAMASGSPQQLIGLRISALAGVKLLEVPYSGLPDCVKNLIGGQIDLAFLPITGYFPGLVDQDRIKGIAALGTARHARLPQLPLAQETRGFEGLSMSLWAGLHVHAQVPEAAVQRLHEAATAAMQAPGFRNAIASTGGTQLPPMSLSDVQRAYEADVQRFQTMAKAARTAKP
jgi:tripartite-type tricarboxylate transporter receptor subunit TctC